MDGVSDEGPLSVLGILQPKSGDRVLDVTLGLAGHARAFLEKIGPRGTLIGIDADAENMETARSNLLSWQKQVTLIHGNFRDVASLVREPVDILFADLGVSSPHFDDPSRGFTFRMDAPLDLRFDQSSGKTAAELLQEGDEEDIGKTFAQYGEFKGGFRLAHAIVSQRKTTPMETTAQFKAIVDDLFGYRAPQILPQIFQALRIRVNDEMGALESLLASVPRLLRPGGRAGIISYHSLEDRLVKRCFRSLTTPERDELTGGDLRPAPFVLLTRKSVTPSPSEIRKNPRARSARFRAVERNASSSSDTL
jgi:16S rRNA (cytosine1402-N4)-methyltransferase